MTNPGCYDGIITISSAAQSANQFYYRTGSIKGSQYDFYSVVEHETDEILGTASCAFGCGGELTPTDLFRYHSNDARSFAGGGNNSCSSSDTQNACFSINGTTMLHQYNNIDNGEDAGDWLTNCSSPLVQDAEGCPGVANLDIGSAEILVLDVAGFTTRPTMTLGQTTLDFGSGGGVITDPQTDTVSFSGNAKLAWTASSNQSNVTVSPPSGTGAATLTITATPGPSAIITVTASGATNSPLAIGVSISTVTPGVPFGSFDTPVTTGNPTFDAAIAETGWALDGIEVTGVDIWREPVTGEPGSSLIFIGNAAFLAGARPDVQADFPATPLNYRAGWGYLMLSNGLPNSSGSGPIGNGTYKLHAIAHNKTGAQTDLGTKTITVDNIDATLPFGTIDTPIQGATVSGLVTNFGWAVTPSITGCPAANQPCIIPTNGSTIVVYVDGIPAAHPVYNINRCDISQSFPNPPYVNSASPNCATNGTSPGPIGYYYLDTTTLSNGIHTIQWSVTDNAGRARGIGARYFTVAN